MDESNLNELAIQNLVKEYNFRGYYITSAKTGQGVIEAFNALIEKLYYKYKKLSAQ